MIECAKCGHRNADGTEFCQNCGTFLGYDGKKLEVLPGSVLLTVTPSMVTVAPGSQAAAEVRVRNKSNIVDQYEIQVTGEPASWTVAEPGTLSLFPDKEGVATVRFRPPRSAEVSAGRKPFVIKVQSKASPEISARQEGVTDVAAVAAVAGRILRAPFVSHNSNDFGSLLRRIGRPGIVCSVN